MFNTSSKLTIVYADRRVGKTTSILHYVEDSEQDIVIITMSQEIASLLRERIARGLGFEKCGHNQLVLDNRTVMIYTEHEITKGKLLPMKFDLICDEFFRFSADGKQLIRHALAPLAEKIILIGTPPEFEWTEDKTVIVCTH